MTSDQITSQELAQILTVLSKAPTTVGEAHSLSSTIDRMVRMVNAGRLIGSEPAPDAVVPEQPPLATEAELLDY